MAGSMIQIMNPKSKIITILRCIVNAVIRRQSTHVHIRALQISQVTCHLGTMLAVIVKTTTIAVHLRVHSFSKYSSYSSRVKLFRKICSMLFLYTMIRPQNLRLTIKIDYIVFFLTGMTRCKTSVSFRMPILSSQYKIKFGLYPIEYRDHFVSIFYSQSAGG